MTENESTGVGRIDALEIAPRESVWSNIRFRFIEKVLNLIPRSSNSVLCTNLLVESSSY
jgi:hypothetical protein